MTEKRRIFGESKWRKSLNVVRKNVNITDTLVLGTLAAALAYTAFHTDPECIEKRQDIYENSETCLKDNSGINCNFDSVQGNVVGPLYDKNICTSNTSGSSSHASGTYYNETQGKSAIRSVSRGGFGSFRGGGG